MGDNIDKAEFSAEDFQAFELRLRAETGILRDLDARQAFSQEGYVVGFEVEAWLLDHGGAPSPINTRLLEAVADPLVVPELSRFNVEFNCDPLPLAGDVLSRALASLSDLYVRSNAVAHGLDANIVMIGTLPNLRDQDLCLDNLSPLKRYAALNSEALRQNGGRSLTVDIEGAQHLRSTHHDVMLEAAATSFQIHLKTPARLAHRFFNASQVASAPVLAAAVNAPFVFGLDVWRETRIPLFEQAVPLTDVGGRFGRVTFGAAHADASLADALAANLAYPVLLPILFDEPPEALRHLRLHNGTIWRWNRALVGFEPDGGHHYRIEHRPLPAGPSMIDMIANAAFYFGLVRRLVDRGLDHEGAFPFADARANLYAAARHGLDAELTWMGRTIAARDLLLEQLLPAAYAGLEAFGVDPDDQALFLGIVEARVRSGQTGADWQRRALRHRRGNLREMMAAYCEGQRSGAPVHEWPV